jgi:hypothetical protein
MPFDDPNTWLQGAGLVKAAFDAFRSAIGGLRDIRSLGGGTEQQQKAIDAALDHAEQTAGVAEAEVAKALGYELCKCEFPPTIMLTVGFYSGRDPTRKAGPVFECPKCRYNTAAPWTYTPLARQKSAE